jgi:hypothetical protein
LLQCWCWWWLWWWLWGLWCCWRWWWSSSSRLDMLTQSWWWIGGNRLIVNGGCDTTVRTVHSYALYVLYCLTLINCTYDIGPYSLTRVKITTKVLIISY